MKRLLSLAGTLLLCLALFPTAALADTGPKPVLTIRVAHPPEGLYYLDLLIPAEEAGTYDNLGETAYDPALLEGLRSWEAEGWVPAFSGGTSVPLFGDLIPDADGVFRFTYFGLPDTFRIAVASAGGARATEEVFTRTAFYTNLIYDYDANAITRSTHPGLSRLVQFLSTLIPTLLVEGALLLLFGFRLRENLLPFLLVNLVTQAGLHLVMGSSFISLSGHFASYLLLMVPAELVIFIAEAAAYARLLRGGTAGRRVGYALAANFISMAVGFFPLRLGISILKTL